MTQRQHFIEAHETIIPVMFMDGHRAAFCNESPFFNRAMTALEALERIEDDAVIQVLRMDTRTWKTECITEEMATIWLNDYERRCGEAAEKEECVFPSFVRQSAMWANRKAALEAAKPLSYGPDYAWKSRRERRNPTVYRATEVRA